MQLPIKVLGTVASIGAGFIGTKLVGAIWHKATGEVPPTPANPAAQQRATMGKALTFAVISGASAAVIQVLTKRWAHGLTEKRRLA